MLFASQTSLFIFKRDNAPSVHFMAWRYKMILILRDIDIPFYTFFYLKKHKSQKNTIREIKVV